jgi:hypothetical protein
MILIFILKIIKNEINNILFNSIIGDNYDYLSIYHYNYDNIKIKHITKKAKDKIICIFGVLVNQEGIKIEKEMLKWLLDEYDVYSVYQKYPGSLYEYPYLRFAQWILYTLNKTILLYLHTKGAFHYHINQFYVRKLWMNEFTHPRNKIYIQFIYNNITDISLPFRKDKITWFNGMFISKRAFDLIPEVPINTYRHFYEGGLFSVVNIRIKGIINDDQSPYTILEETLHHLKILNQSKINAIIEEVIILGFIIIIKLYIKRPFKIFKKKRQRKIPLKLINKFKIIH